MILSFAVLLATSSRGFGVLAGTMDSMHVAYSELSSQSNHLQIYAWEAQKRLLGALYESSIGSEWSVVEEEVSQMERALAEARGIMVKLFTLEELNPDQFEALDEVYAGFEGYAAPFATVSRVFKAGNTPSPEDVRKVDEGFAALTQALDKLDRVVGDDIEGRYQGVKSTIQKMYSILFIVVLVSTILVAVVLALTSRSITGAIKRLGGFTVGVGAGDLKALSTMAGRDEIGTIASSIDGLVVALRNLISTLKERLDALAQREQELIANIEETGASVTQINGNIESNGRRLSKEAQAVDELSAAMEETARGVESLNGLISRQSQILETSAAAVEELIANVEGVARSAQEASHASSELKREGAEGRSRIDAVNESVQSIVQVSQNLSEAVKVIQEISSRTNLLAMNAAIEAAHAGESGRGFAVVADEIRKLAEQSSLQAKDISKDLGLVSTSIESVRGAARGVTLAFGSIVDKTGPLDDEIRNISDAMREQGTGGAQVLDELAQLRAISGDVLRSSTDMAAGNKIILEQITNLKAINGAVVGSEKEIAGGTAEIQSAVRETTNLAAMNAEALSDVLEVAGRFTI